VSMRAVVDLYGSCEYDGSGQSVKEN